MVTTLELVVRDPLYADVPSRDLASLKMRLRKSERPLLCSTLTTVGALTLRS